MAEFGRAAGAIHGRWTTAFRVSTVWRQVQKSKWPTWPYEGVRSWCSVSNMPKNSDATPQFTQAHGETSTGRCRRDQHQRCSGQGYTHETMEIFNIRQTRVVVITLCI